MKIETKQRIYDAVSAFVFGMLIAGMFVFIGKQPEQKQSRWGIPPNAIVEYEHRTCYMWKIPSVEYPRQQYIYCEPNK